jgi:Leucine-rich repeat (LRR) protein
MIDSNNFLLSLFSCSLSDLDFLGDFSHLQSLILDNNQVSSHSKLARLPKLVVLSLTCNAIQQLEQFVAELAIAAPSLQYLSLLGNAACPYFDAPHRYCKINKQTMSTKEKTPFIHSLTISLSVLPSLSDNYRIFVISKFPHLKHLDSSAVTDEESRHAACLKEDQQN